MKVLVVEDNRINRIVVHDLLVRDGHTVDLAFDGHQGVEAAKTKSYDLVLMDISMPVMDGIEATREIRATETGRHAFAHRSPDGECYPVRERPLLCGGT